MTDRPSLSALTHTFARIGLMSFGGPVAQIGVMQRELVEDRGWLDEARFLKALSFCMMLPGPEAMQLCTYAGWRLRGTLGGLIAGALFVLPGALVMGLLAFAYLRWGVLPGVSAAFLGVKAVVIVVVVQALIKLGRRALTGRVELALAALAFAALWLGAPFPAVIALAALVGALRPRTGAPETEPPAPASLLASLRTALVWAALWWAPIAALALAGQAELAGIGVFFSHLAVVSFGGAYALLAYLAQAAVEARGWLTEGQMLDGLGLAETTPGPLILVTEFVGYLAGQRLGGTGSAIAAAALTVWATFAPCFLYIFTLAPHLERLTAAPRLASALAAISAAVTGVIAQLASRFALHTLFSDAPGGALPALAGLDPVALALTALAALCLVWLRLSLPLTLVALAALGWLAGAIV